VRIASSHFLFHLEPLTNAVREVNKRMRALLRAEDEGCMLATAVTSELLVCYAFQVVELVLEGIACDPENESWIRK
jgi:hypothetical protein